MGYEEARKQSESWTTNYDMAERMMTSGFEDGDTMFSVRAKPWHGIGLVLQESPKTIEEALTLSGLDWTVSKRPVFFEALNADGDAEFQCADNMHVMVRDDNNVPLGTVTDRYKDVQNRAAFSFLDNLLGSSMYFETAGSLYSGRKVFIVARMPEWIEVGGDHIEEFVTFANSHDGTGSVKVYVTPIRTVCQNTLNVSWREARGTYSIRHVGNPSLRLAQAKSALDLSTDYYKQFKEFGDSLASQKIAEREVMRVFDDFYGEAKTDRAVKNRDEAKEQISFIMNNSPTAGNAPGSKWSAFNAGAEYLDYYRPMRDTGRGKDAALFGRAMFEVTQPKQRWLDMVLAA